MSVIETLEEEQIARARECFNLYAPKGALPRSELHKVLRSLNANPTMAEIESLAGSKLEVEFPDLLEILAHAPSPLEAKQQVLKAFKTYDVAGKGTISQAEFKGIMKTMGEGLTDAEINSMLSKAGASDPIQYADFVEKVMP